MATPTPIHDDLIDDLLEGENVEIRVVYDVSDVQLYGRKNKRFLTGTRETQARAQACKPVVYQSVEWWTLAFLPVKPIRTLCVMPCMECHEPEADQYRVVVTDWDRSQILMHYLVGWGGLLILCLLVLSFNLSKEF